MGNVRRKMTSLNSKHGVNESKVFFIVLIATCSCQESVHMNQISVPRFLRTIVPLRAMLDPAVRTRATATLPKLPSPISFMTSNLSSRVAIDVGAVLRGRSYVTVIVNGCVDYASFCQQRTIRLDNYEAREAVSEGLWYVSRQHHGGDLPLCNDVRCIVY